MFYVKSKDGSFCESFDTRPAAMRCAKQAARRLGMTLTIIRGEPIKHIIPDADPEPMGTLGEVYDTLESFDWFYEMSDDHRVWKRGEAAKARLESLAGNTIGGMELVEAYRNHIYSGEPWNTTKAPKPTRPE